jgi:hypothetical protein
MGENLGENKKNRPYWGGKKLIWLVKIIERLRATPLPGC